MLLTSRNYHIQIREYTFTVESLPVAADGYRICFLSDLHIGSIRSLDDQVCRLVESVEFDVLLLGGDYFEGPVPAFQRMRFAQRLVAAVGQRAPVLAVFGNHDTNAIADEFVQAGIRSIEETWVDLAPVNAGGSQASGIRIHGAGLSLAGVTHLKHGPRQSPDCCNILLTHSPDFAFVARDRGYDLYLCGHTHAGQVCLPGGRMIMRGTKMPRRICARQWQLDGMAGYTSPGIGTSILPLRVNCPPEAAVITLRASARDGLNSEENRARSDARISASSAS